MAVPLQFLAGARADREGDRILVVQSGLAWHAVRLVDALRERYPTSAVTALVRRAEEGAVPKREGVEYVFHGGATPALVRRLIEGRFDRVFVLATDDPGYWKLKALPLALGASAVYVVNENLDWFPLDVRHTSSLAQHLRARLESSITFAGGVRAPAFEKVQKALLYPAVLAYLLGYERAHQLAARLRGLGPWKRENRPDQVGAPR